MDTPVISDAIALFMTSLPCFDIRYVLSSYWLDWFSQHVLHIDLNRHDNGIYMTENIGSLLMTSWHGNAFRIANLYEGNQSITSEGQMVFQNIPWTFN